MRLTPGSAQAGSARLDAATRNGTVTRSARNAYLPRLVEAARGAAG